MTFLWRNEGCYTSASLSFSTTRKTFTCISTSPIKKKIDHSSVKKYFIVMYHMNINIYHTHAHTAFCKIARAVFNDSYLIKVTIQHEFLSITCNSGRLDTSPPWNNYPLLHTTVKWSQVTRQLYNKWDESLRAYWHNSLSEGCLHELASWGGLWGRTSKLVYDIK